MVETALGTALVSSPGSLHRPVTSGRPAARRAVGVAAITRRADRKQAPQCRQVFWRSGTSTASERAGRSPTGQRVRTVAQQHRPARSVGARGGHEGPVALPGPHPTSSPLPTLLERAAARQPGGAVDAASPVEANNRAHRSLQNRADAVSHSDHSHHPLLLKKNNATGRVCRPVFEKTRFEVTADNCGTGLACRPARGRSGVGSWGPRGFANRKARMTVPHQRDSGRFWTGCGSTQRCSAATAAEIGNEDVGTRVSGEARRGLGPSGRNGQQGTARLPVGTEHGGFALKSVRWRSLRRDQLRISPACARCRHADARHRWAPRNPQARYGGFMLVDMNGALGLTLGVSEACRPGTLACIIPCAVTRRHSSAGRIPPGNCRVWTPPRMQALSASPPLSATSGRTRHAKRSQPPDRSDCGEARRQPNRRRRPATPRARVPAVPLSRR